MSSKKDFNKIKAHGVSTFLREVEKGAFSKVRDMLERGLGDVHAKTTERGTWSKLTTEVSYAPGSTALHIACQQGNAVMVSLLLKFGANPNVRNRENLSPMDYALQSMAYYQEAQGKKKFSFNAKAAKEKNRLRLKDYESILTELISKGGKAGLYSLPPGFGIKPKP